MNNHAKQLLSALERRGFLVRLKDEGLQVIPFDKLTPADRDAIKLESAALVRLLSEWQSAASELSAADGRMIRWVIEEFPRSRLIEIRTPQPRRAFVGDRIAPGGREIDLSHVLAANSSVASSDQRCAQHEFNHSRGGGSLPGRTIKSGGTREAIFMKQARLFAKSDPPKAPKQGAPSAPPGSNDGPPPPDSNRDRASESQVLSAESGENELVARFDREFPPTGASACRATPSSCS
jgi:hypothetical protein